MALMSNFDFLEAAAKGDLESLSKFLSSTKIDINTKNILKLKTLIIFKSKFFHNIENLNSLWNFTPTFNETALICAAWRGHKEIVELLLRQEGIDINIQDILNQKHS